MTSWQPLYLRAPDKATIIGALDEAGLAYVDPDTGEQRLGGDPFIIRLHYFGTLYRPTNDPDVDPVAVDGCHVNVSVHPQHAEHYADSLRSVLLDPPPETPLIRPAL